VGRVTPVLPGQLAGGVEVHVQRVLRAQEVDRPAAHDREQPRLERPARVVSVSFSPPVDHRGLHDVLRIVWPDNASRARKQERPELILALRQGPLVAGREPLSDGVRLRVSAGRVKPADTRRG
jgi:hypothetical protein